MLAKPDPYLIAGPALISFSGGRTSGYMLHEIVRAHGGTLPADVHVTFADTGKEREETLRFVHDCATHWNVRVRWGTNTSLEFSLATWHSPTDSFESRKWQS